MAPGGNWTVEAERRISYRVQSCAPLFAPENATLASFGAPGGHRFVVADAEVWRHHGDAMRHYFQHHGITPHFAILPGGEEAKGIDRYRELVQKLDLLPIHRRAEPVLALGGGVLTDIVAFVAATYRRGIPHVKVPTTLMGYVDAAIGVKCGINFDGFKNRLGSFEAPLAVLLDRTFLETLSARHLKNGLCEIIKLALIADGALFRLLEERGAESLAARFQNEAGGRILDAAIGGMLAELAPNLFEDDLARKVDFGHSFSYGLEARHPDTLLHGEAVLLDILVSVALAQARGLLADGDAARVFRLVRVLDIVLDPAVLDLAAMWEALLDRVLHRDGRQRVPIPAGIGQCVFLNDVRRHELDAAISSVRRFLEESHAAIIEH